MQEVHTIQDEEQASVQLGQPSDDAHTTRVEGGSGPKQVGLHLEDNTRRAAGQGAGKDAARTIVEKTDGSDNEDVWNVGVDSKAIGPGKEIRQASSATVMIS